MLEGGPERERPVRFALGEEVVPPAALLALAPANTSVDELLARHQAGDYGSLCAENRAVNRRALLVGTRVLSQYDLPNGDKVWIITEGERDWTTVLLAREY